jgi:threonine dehydrogenase-like Zn-dependent dehydrogenase
MKALRKTQAAAGLELADVPMPQPRSPDEVLVRVTATGICGSDLHVDDWTSSYAFITASLPVTLGHEFVGVVQTGPLQGRRVVVRPSVTCGRCIACVQGRPDDCQHRSSIGLMRDGSFDPWVRVPLRNCVPIPSTLSDELAALAEPMSIAMQALRVAGPVHGLRVLVMGPGPIGQGIALLARRAGAAQVVVSGFGDAARFGVLRRMGFEALIDLSQGDLATLAPPHTGGAEFDLVIEATGVPETIHDALPLLRRDGVVVVTGIHARPLSLDLTRLVRRQHQVRGSFRPAEADWAQTLLLLGELADVIEPMVSHVLPLRRIGDELAPQGYGSLAGKMLLRRRSCND